MKHDADFRKLRLQQLERALLPYGDLRNATRPQAGWLSAIREARGFTLRDVAQHLAVTPQAVLKLQRSETSESISIKRLREVAEAMDCDLAYALVPRSGKLTDVVEERNRKNAADRVIAAEHTMLLEDQAAGNLEARMAVEQSRSKGKS